LDEDTRGWRRRLFAGPTARRRVWRESADIYHLE